VTTDRKALVPDIELATSLFENLRRATGDVEGVTRASYSSEENLAHGLMRDAAVGFGLKTRTDRAGNLYMTLEGQNRGAPPYVIGSHLDSVKCGGNFDGAAGVVAGLAIASAYVKTGRKPPRDLIVMATRAEESMWFSCSYIGSRAALGLFDPALADEVRRVDTGRTLREHAAECGFDFGELQRGIREFAPESLGGFFEIHIEQGPVLDDRKVPVGIVPAVRGNFRYRYARCIGEYGHCGTVPRQLRHDAVVGLADLIGRLDAVWDDYERRGADVAVTVGVVQTDERVHSVSKIAGEVRFALDVRSQSQQTLRELEQVVNDSIGQIASRRGVAFELGQKAEALPALMDTRLREALGLAADRLGVSYLDLPSGAGHDAAMFAAAGVPTALIFIRNANGSHNPRESMQIDDFASAAAVLVETLEDGALR
jgi:beta-ureidopropionase / N-carbamoyl-L-amino-acid hydrolase